MTRTGSWTGRVGGALLVFASGLGVPAAASHASEGVPVEGGYRNETKTTYTLDPGAGAVHVAYDVTVTNETPDRVTAAGRYSSYLSSITVPVLSEAVGLRATKSDGTTLSVSTRASESPRFLVAVVTLRPSLFYPHSQTLRFTYDLPRVAARADGFIRLNDAYATFPVLAFGDPGRTAVDVVVPTAFDVELVGDEMQRTEVDGQQIFKAEAISDPEGWFVQVAARDDTKLTKRNVVLESGQLRVLGWPDDAAWADFTASQVEDGVPVLEEVVGLDWPGSDVIDVVETASPYLYGYAGWYRRDLAVIEVGDDLDQQVILHELSHLWFNDTLFADRWISEGLANEVSALAIGKLGGAPPAALPIDPADPGRQALNEWSRPNLQAGSTDDQERYGYNAAWAVLSALVADVGPDHFAAILQQADAGRDAYQSSADEAHSQRVFGWREVLDLFEEVGGSDRAAGLFERHVVSTADRALLDVRTSARSSYAALVAAGKGWRPPRSVRAAMSRWSFSTAEDLIDDATSVLVIRDDLAAVADDLDVSGELALRPSYEAATNLDTLRSEAADALAAARVLRVAEDAHDDGAGPLGAVGLLFSSVDDDMARADAAFEQGHYRTARAEAAQVRSAMEEAPKAGIIRLLGLALILGLIPLLLKARRSRRPAVDGRLEPDGAEGVGGPADGGGERWV